MLANISTEALRRAIVIREQIDRLQAELAAIEGGSSRPTDSVGSSGRGRGGRRQMSEESKNRIREGQRRRWAREKGGAASETKAAKATSTKSSDGRRQMSEDAKNRIREAQRRRWARQKAAAKKG